jgi:DNA polymerase-3 subunit gamma/tau
LRGTPQDQLERIRQQSAAFGPGALSRSADIVNAGLTEMTGATAPRLQLELICARVLLPGASGENGYAARLDRLERRLEMTGANPPVRREPVAGPAPAAEMVVEPPHLRPGAPGKDETPAGVAPTASPSATQRVPDQVPHGAGAPGGIDTDAIRRSWPDILAKIFTIRRTTWTFLSEHTQVLDYDGSRLLLGIQTEGLANTFRRGHHGELVRQALSEVLGVEAKVEGIPTVQQKARPVLPAAASASATIGQSDASSPQPDPRATSAGSAAPPVSARPGVSPEAGSTPMQRARAAVAREESTSNVNASSSVADDSMVSADDEDIVEAVAVGQPVIARILGGTVIGELDQ